MEIRPLYNIFIEHSNLPRDLKMTTSIQTHLFV